MRLLDLGLVPYEQALARQEEAAKLQREIERLEQRARNEKQPKKKFELGD